MELVSRTAAPIRLATAPTPPPAAPADGAAAAADAPKDDYSEIVVTLDDQSIDKINKAFSMPTGLKRREYVVKTLLDTANRTQTPIAKVIDGLAESGHADPNYKRLWIQNSIVMRGDDTALSTLQHAAGVADAARSQVHKLDLPNSDLATAVGGGAAVKDPQWNIAKVGAPAAWADGLTGKGVVMASLDSGVDVQHPALLTNFRGYDPETGTIDITGNWFDATGESPNAMTDNPEEPHGTHTTGTMVGSDGRTNRIGVAPDAKWFAARGLGPDGGTDGQLLRGFQYLAAPLVPTPGVSPGSRRDVTLGPHIINNSWGTDNGWSTDFTPALRNMAAMGIVNMFAAGNDGNYGAPSSVGTPAANPYTISVAATDRAGKVASFSSRGPNPQQVSPNEDPTPFVAAPGVDVRSSVMNGAYERGWSGTSMATPAASGVAALADQAAMDAAGRSRTDPFKGSLDIFGMRDVLKGVAQLASGGKPANNNVGYGNVDASNLRPVVQEVLEKHGLVKPKHDASQQQG